MDFNNKTFEYILKEMDKQVEGFLTTANIKKGNPLILEYNLDDELKKIIVDLL